MADIDKEQRAAAATERAAFYEAAGFEPGELITQRSLIRIDNLSGKYSELWMARAGQRAVPTGQFCRRAPAKAALRSEMKDVNGQERVHIQGVASVTDRPYEMYDFMGPYDEVVSRAAFVDTLASDPDVPFLLNHSGMTMARTKNGTLTLAMGETGLQVDAYCNPKRSDVADMAQAIRDGEVDEMSFAFMIEEGQWSEDYSQFTITRLDINRGDVSAVNLGANPFTSVAVRTTSILKDLSKLETAAAQRAREILDARPDIEKLDRLTEAFARLDREEDEARKSRDEAKRGGQSGEESLGRSVAVLEALLAIDEEG